MRSPLQTRHERLALVRYLAVGALVCCTYVALTLVLSAVAGLPMWLAIAIGYALAVALHFFLQRRFVFAHVDNFALPHGAQLRRYLLIAMGQYVITTAATELLPGPLEVSAEVVYVATVPLITVVAFLMLRSRVFHDGEAEPDAALGPPRARRLWPSTK